MGRAWRGWRVLRNIGIGLVALHLVARFFAAVPMSRYAATCGADMFERTYIEGPYNERFLHLLEWAMQNNEFTYSRSNGQVHIPYVGFWNETYDGYDDFSLNTDWKLVTGIAEGIKIDGVHVPPPKPLVDLIEATKEKYGAYVERTPSGEYNWGFERRFHDSEDACAFMRAAILPDPKRPD